MTLSVQHVVATLENQGAGDQRSLMRQVSGDEKFNMTHSVSGSCENSQLMLTEPTLFDKNPFTQFTLSKIKEMLFGNHRSQLLQLKEQMLNYYNKINLAYKNKKAQRSLESAAQQNESSEVSQSTQKLSKWDDVWVGKGSLLKQEADARQILDLKSKVEKIQNKLV